MSFCVVPPGLLSEVNRRNGARTLLRMTFGPRTHADSTRRAATSSLARTPSEPIGVHLSYQGPAIKPIPSG